jgi:hypothetical protein
MITRIEAHNYRCLRHVAQDLGPFHILVGPNASGKSTFLDIPILMRDVVRYGRTDIGEAVSLRSPNYSDLVWNKSGTRFEVAVEAEIPSALRDAVGNLLGDLGVVPPTFVCRYELAIGSPSEAEELGILHEALLVGEEAHSGAPRGESAGPSSAPPPTIMISEESDDWETILRRSQDGLVILRPETGDPAVPRLALRLNRRISALANVPYDEAQWPIATWVTQFLLNNVRSVALNSSAMRQPSPPNARRAFMADGSSIPWLLDKLAPRDYEQWLAHLRTELPNLAGIRSFERPEDRHRYLMLKYEDGLEVPSWVVSDGTLEMLALTLLPYLPDKDVTYLVEEPENCVHPTAIEAIFESLSSVYGGQVLMATHSPVILGLAELEHVLCFTKDEQGAINIVPGKEHRILRNWRGEVNLGVLFASGVMG